MKLGLQPRAQVLQSFYTTVGFRLTTPGSLHLTIPSAWRDTLHLPFGSLSGEFTSVTVEEGGTVKYTANSVVVTFQ